MQKLKNIYAILILAVFLFPLVKSEVHNYAHINDFHCVSSAFHLHQEEHHCNLCDITFDYYHSPDFTNHNFILTEIGELAFLPAENNVRLQETYFRSLRAPPAFA